MSLVNLQYETLAVEGRFRHLALPESEFLKFNTGILGLGDVSREGKHVDVLAAFLDLEGFTTFCNQLEPHLIIPEYLDQLLHWLFFRLSSLFVKERRAGKVILWGKFPFFAKFLGDGILFLWETRDLGQASLGNIVVNLYRVCRAYPAEFLPEIQKSLTRVPKRLRCGISRGEVVAIGGGRDFVGSCVNLAARLQKTSQLSFVCARKGFSPEECFSSSWLNEFAPKRFHVRGLDEEELILVLRSEFESLPDSEKQLFKDV